MYQSPDTIVHRYSKSYNISYLRINGMHTAVYEQAVWNVEQVK